MRGPSYAHGLIIYLDFSGNIIWLDGKQYVSTSVDVNTADYYWPIIQSVGWSSDVN